MGIIFRHMAWARERSTSKMLHGEQFHVLCTTGSDGNSPGTTERLTSR